MGRVPDPGAHQPHHPAGHRGLGEILAILDGSRLAPEVRDMASRVFRRLADAEARVHGTTPERVHFHDVGAVDAIVDVTGCCIGLHLLGVDAVHFGALPVGGGFIDGPHGRIPVPGPGHRGAAEGLPDPRHRDPRGAGDPDRRRHPDHAGRRRGRDARDDG